MKREERLFVTADVFAAVADMGHQKLVWFTRNAIVAPQSYGKGSATRHLYRLSDIYFVGLAYWLRRATGARACLLDRWGDILRAFKSRPWTGVLPCDLLLVPERGGGSPVFLFDEVSILTEIGERGLLDSAFLLAPVGRIKERADRALGGAA